MREHESGSLRLSFLVLFTCGAVACTGSTFDTASADEDSGAGTDIGVATDGVAVDSGGGGGDSVVPPGDVSPGDGSVACVPLAAGSADVYVDKRFAGATGNGTEGCPFTTITAAIAVGGSFSARTIHVAGGTVTVVYNEPSSILVNHNVVILGDGPMKTTINASGPCGTGTCAVQINSGGTLDGFTVVSSGGDGIVTSAGTPAPIAKNVSSNGSRGHGINVLGSAELGPNISANRNGGQGVYSAGSGVVHIGALTGAGLTNTFDSNGLNGIDIDGNATLLFDGGTASSNTNNGVRLAYAPASGTGGPSHTITGLTALSNKGAGIVAFNGQNLKIRSSKLLTNTVYGLSYQYAGIGLLDIGTPGEAGANTFGVTTAAARNGKGGVFLCKSRGPATQPAEGDGWSVCGPSQAPISGCDTTPTSYLDIVYAPAVAGNPIVVTSCTAGP